MDTKNRMTNFLLHIAKKHRILTYPVLALVALISVISYLFNWSTGAGKRIVAVVMVLVMLVSQSCFLTSSATEITDDVTDNPLVMGNSDIDQLYIEDDLEDNTVADEALEPIEAESESDDESEDENADAADDVLIEDITVEKTTEVERIDEVNDVIPAGNDEGDGGATTPSETDLTVELHYVDENNSEHVTSISSVVPRADDVAGSAIYNLGSFISGWITEANSNSAYTGEGCYQFDGVYSDATFTSQITGNYIAPSTTKTAVLFLRRTQVKYRVSIVTGSTSDDVTFTTSSSDIVNGYYYVPLGTGFTISDIERFGYRLTSATGGSLEAGVVTVPSTTTSDVVVTFGWTGKEYNIVYAATEEGTGSWSQQVFYDDAQSLIAESGAADKLGYTFECWVDDDGDEYIPGASVLSYQDKLFYDADVTSATIMLRPRYTYDGIEVTDNLELAFDYQDELNAPIYIKGHYKNANKTSGNFTYVFTNSSNNNLTAYNLMAVPTSQGIEITTTGPICKTTGTDGPVYLTFKISDPAKSGYSTEEIKVSITVNQRSITLLAPTTGSTTKTYNGTTNTELSSVNNAPTNIEGITWSATGGAYDSANVDATCIVYPKENVVLNCANVSDNGNYVISNYSIEAKIKPRTIALQTSVKNPEDEEIRAGEANPEFTVSEVEEYKATDGSPFGIISTDSIDDILAGISYETNRPADDLLATGTYKIIPVFSFDNSNYVVDEKITSAYAGTFTVIQETPDGKYSVSDGTGLVGEWLRADSTITANTDSGYDTVYVSRDGVDFQPFSGVLKDEDTDSDYYLYLYDTATNAQTSVKKLTLKIDSIAPVYLGYTVVEADNFTYTPSDVLTSIKNGGLYFPSIGSVLDFGTYIHTSMTIKIKYEDVTSGLGDGAGLYYSLFGSSDLNGPVVFDEDGYATVSLNQNLVAGADTKVGVIKCYAKDTAGNASKTVTLSPNESDIYEWSIESKGPEISSLTAYSGNNKITSSTDYYHDCKVSVDVVDAVSGLQKIVWNVNGQEVTDTTSSEDTDRVVLVNGKVTEKKTYQLPINQASFPSQNAYYEISATVYDNAGNSTSTGNSVAFYVDDVVPELKVNYDPKEGEYTSDSKITFTTSDDLSGVKSAYVENPDGSAHNCSLMDAGEDGIYSGSFEITAKGKYTLYVEDKAGNVNSWTREINNISKTTPDCPSVSVSPKMDAENTDTFWFNKATGEPTVTITNVRETSDGTPATTYYRHHKNDESVYDEATMTSSETSRTIKISDDGIHYFQYWSESASKVRCENADDHIQVVRYDGTAPVIKIEAEQTNGSSIVVRYTVTDEASGVNKDTVHVLRNDKVYNSTIEEIENGYTGTFTVNETGNYIVTANDMAGNEAEVLGFTPMSMVVNAVTNITTTKANLSALVTKGTSDITTAPTISIRKESSETYTECDTNAECDETTGNWKVAASLDSLTENTTYIYRVRAVSDIGEILEYEGYFRTLAINVSGVTFTGIAGYYNGVIPDNKNGMIAVGLYEGNICIRASYVHTGDKFVFENVPDGSYNIVATDGTYSRTLGVVIQDGRIVKPLGTISLMLSGKNTSVVISTPETPRITADNMDSIFDYDTVNYNADDRALIQANGTVEFKLYATLKKVTSVSSDEIAAMYSVTSKDKIVGAYLDLSLYKITTDKNGNSERTQVTQLSNDANISVTIPLGDLAGKEGLEVVRIHDTGDRFVGAVLSDQDGNPNTFTIVTNQFSTYAILYSPEKEPTTEDKTTEGKTTEDKTTEDKTTGDKTTEDKTTRDKTTEDKTTEDKPTNTSQSSTQEVKPIPGKKPASGASFSSVSTSSGYAKTGDETPIVLLSFVMMVSLAGAFFIKRKTH